MKLAEDSNSLILQLETFLILPSFRPEQSNRMMVSSSPVSVIGHVESRGIVSRWAVPHADDFDPISIRPHVQGLSQEGQVFLDSS